MFNSDTDATVPPSSALPISPHETTRSAMEEARECMRKGFHDVSLTDLGTGIRSSAGDIKKKLDRIDEFYRDSW